jgi:alanyl-tRNA synthetase
VQKKLKSALGAKGGGKPEMIQGSVSGTEDAIRKALA